MLPTDEDAANALEYLSNTDAQYAQQVGALEAAKHLVKVERAGAVLESKGTVAEKEAHAELDPSVLEAHGNYVDALTDLETTRTRRKRAELVIDVWRTHAANQRRGNV